MKTDNAIFTLNDVALRGRMMRAYFLMEATLGAFTDPKTIFDFLAKKVFRIDPREVADCFKFITDDNVVSIRTKTEHETAMRAIKYSQVYGGIPIVLSRNVAFAVACKGEVLELVDKLRNELVGCADIGEAVRILEKRASGNMTTAMFILGLAYCELLGSKCDVKKGLAYLEKCARWNNVDASLAYLCYADSEKRKEFLPIFKAQIEGLYDEAELEAFVEIYGGREVIADPVARLVRAYLENAESEAETLYSPRIANIVASPYLSEHDKKRCVEKGAEELVGIVSEYALKGVKAKVRSDVAMKSFVSPSRAPEAEYIESYLSKCVAKLLKKLPLLVCSDDFILECYAKALSEKLDGIEVITLDLAELDKVAFAPLKGNVIVSRQVNRNASAAVFILKNADRLDGEAAAELVKMFDGARSGSYMLQDVGISLDLSGNTFILASTTDNVARGILSKCHPFNIAKADKSERIEFIGKAFSEWCSPYFGCIEIGIDKEATELLASKEPEVAQSIVERICLTLPGGGSYTIKVEDVKAGEALVSTSGGFGFRVR